MQNHWVTDLLKILAFETQILVTQNEPVSNNSLKKLRIVVLRYHPTSAVVTIHIKDALLKGRLEWGWDEDRTRGKIASWIVLPALANIEQDTDTTVQ